MDPKWWIRFPERPDLEMDPETYEVDDWEREFERDGEDKP